MQTDPVSARERLQILQAKLAQTQGNEIPQLAALREANIASAIEISDALAGLNFAINDFANRAATVLGNLTKTIEAATAQAEVSSTESTKVAKESATLSEKLNRLTRWIIVVAVASSLAALVQAGVALYTVWR